MSEERKGVLNQILGCMASPRKAFESIQEEDLWKGVVLILILTSVSALAGYNYASKLPVTIPEGFGPHGPFRPPGQFVDPQTFRRNIMTLYALRDGLRAVAGWLIPAVLLHLSATLLVGKGSLKRTLAQTAFASIPLLIQQAIRLIDAYTISAEELLSVVSAQPLGHTLTLRFVSNVLSVFTVFGIWAFALTVVAASINYGGSKSRTLTATTVAYLAFVVMRVFIPV